LGCPNLNYYFLEDIPRNIQGQDGGSNYFAFMPLDQQKNKNYSRYEYSGCIIGSRRIIII